MSAENTVENPTAEMSENNFDTISHTSAQSISEKCAPIDQIDNEISIDTPNKNCEDNMNINNADSNLSSDDEKHVQKNNEETNDSDNEIFTSKVRKKHKNVIHDTDSESEKNDSDTPSLDNENKESSSSIKGTSDAKHKKKLKMSASPDEDESKKRHRNKIFDTDSESENDSDISSLTTKNKKSPSDIKKKTDIEKQNKSKISTLVDTDSEEDVPHENLEQSFEEHKPDTSAKKSTKSAQKKMGSERASMNEARRQIFSETQRLIRSSTVHLPYHRPKQRTLQDFLNRKTSLPALPQGLTTAAKVKMSTAIVGKVLEEKEKEAELFYKSSDSEEENEEETVSNVKSIDETPFPAAQRIEIEETQKILKNDMQNAHNKKEIIQQAGMDIGVPRKLFIDEPKEALENYDVPDSQENMEVDDSVIIDARKKIKETKQGLRDGNAPRKLFTSDYDEGVDSPPKEDSPTLTPETESTELRKNDEIDADNVDEGIHSLEKAVEVSSSSDCEENNTEKKSCISISPEPLKQKMNSLELREKQFTESLDISETPFISNKEYAKLNEREKSSKQREETDNTKNSKDESTLPYGHVLGLPPPEIDDEPLVLKSASIKKKLISKLSNVGPKLRGSPGMIIDFSDDPKPNKEGIQSLLDRFAKHSTVKKSTENHSPITVMHTQKTADGVKIVEENLPYKLPVNDPFCEKELQKPGAKHTRLKMDLIEKMAKKRAEEWTLKEQREKDENEENVEKDEEEKCCIELTDDEEEEGTTESEPEEDDMPIEKPKNRKRHGYEDDEAEVSDENEEIEENEEDEEEDDEENISLRVENDVDENSNDTNSITEESTPTQRRSRIIKPSEEDSNSQPDAFQTGEARGGKVLERTKTDVDMFEPEKDAWCSDSEAEFPPSQFLSRDQSDARSQACKTPLTAINALRFVSPITQLTALNSFNDSPASNEISLTGRRMSDLFDKTPIGVKNSPNLSDNNRGFQKKLFEDPSGTVNDEELMSLCSGKFTCTEVEERASDSINISSNNKVTESQLLDICSGPFTSKNLDIDDDEKREDKIGENSGKDEINSDEDTQGFSDKLSKKNEAKDPWSLKIDSSSSDDEVSKGAMSEGKKKVLKKKKVKKLDLSDEEDDDDVFSEEELEQDILDDDAEDKYVDYDSEENEVVIVPKKDIKKVAANFLEAEAELSESEWGSEDEDEKDLDKLEFEEGDNEEIDENQMRDQLGKLHMRQIQDDDQREVRMLQELLFDDGDLHTDGSGRERKFKWKNIDQIGNDDNFVRGDDAADENLDPVENENDLEWRKERIEREKFIEEKMNSDQVIEELADDSQVFKLGLQALKKSKSSNQGSQKEAEPVIPKPIAARTVVDLVESQKTKQHTTFHKAVSRGSFLARGDECLARLAVYIDQYSKTTNLESKKTGNFVFAHVSATTATEETEESLMVEKFSSETVKKRKAPADSPRSAKKPRVVANRKTGKK